MTWIPPFPDNDVSSIGRAWLITAEQFMDVVAQENDALAGDLDDLVLPVLAGSADDALIGSGAYNRMVRCGEQDGVPAWTFTTEVDFSEFKLNAPSDAYLDTLAAGLVETAGFSLPEAHAYLRALPGADAQASRVR